MIKDEIVRFLFESPSRGKVSDLLKMTHQATDMAYAACDDMDADLIDVLYECVGDGDDDEYSVSRVRFFMKRTMSPEEKKEIFFSLKTRCGP